MDSLTEEQRARIAKNREEALRRLEERKKRLADETIRGDVSRGQPSSLSLTTSTFAWPVNGFKKPTTTCSLFSNVSTKRVQPAIKKNTTKQSVDSMGSTNNSVHALSIDSNVRPSSSAIKICLSVMNEQYVKVDFSPFHISIVDTLKALPTRQYNEADKIWSIRFSDYEPLIAKLRTLNRVRIDLEELPNGVKMVFRNEIYDQTCNRKQTNSEDLCASLSGIDDALVASLFPYQKRGVLFGIEKGGRILMADEMGLGKSVQALALAQKYNAEWPLLIVCPSSVKSAWRIIQKFLPSVADVYMIDKGSDVLPKSRSTSIIVIMSYDQMNIKLRELLDHSFYVVIFDESHLLKEMKSKRTKCALDISKKAIRVILLSGTPALSRPVELYPQIKIINPKIFTNLQQFGLRYCDGKQGRYAFEMKGATNTDELAAVLKKTIMIRRLKKDVLQDLPAKRREIIYLSGDSINHSMKCLKDARKALLKSNNSRNAKDKHETLMQYYVETGIVKAHSVAQHIVENYFYEGAERRKILIFAHHGVVLDTVSTMVSRKDIKYIRIDGSTPQKERGRLCEEFQTKDDVLVAILSITAAGVGITLTAASVVVFAELHWNPGSMIQAEDRAHRVGQRDSVLVQYMLAKNTADDEIWPLVENKLKMLGSVNLSSDSYKDAENLHRECSDRAITSYFERLANSEKSSMINSISVVDDDDDLEILNDDRGEEKQSVVDDLKNSRAHPNEDGKSDISFKSMSDIFNSTGASRRGGFEIEDDDDDIIFHEDCSMIEASVSNPKRGRH